MKTDALIACLRELTCDHFVTYAIMDSLQNACTREKPPRKVNRSLDKIESHADKMDRSAVSSKTLFKNT